VRDGIFARSRHRTGAGDIANGRSALGCGVVGRSLTRGRTTWPPAPPAARGLRVVFLDGGFDFGLWFVAGFSFGFVFSVGFAAARPIDTKGLHGGGGTKSGGGQGCLIVAVVIGVARALVFEAAAMFGKDAVIMVRVLHVIFGQNPVAGRSGIARQALVFFQQLMRIAAHARVVAIALFQRPADPAALLTTAIASTAAAALAISYVQGANCSFELLPKCFPRLPITPRIRGHGPKPDLEKRSRLATLSGQDGALLAGLP